MILEIIIIIIIIITIALYLYYSQIQVNIPTFTVKNINNPFAGNTGTDQIIKYSSAPPPSPVEIAQETKNAKDALKYVAHDLDNKLAGLLDDNNPMTQMIAGTLLNMAYQDAIEQMSKAMMKSLLKTTKTEGVMGKIGMKLVKTLQKLGQSCRAVFKTGGKIGLQMSKMALKNGQKIVTKLVGNATRYVIEGAELAAETGLEVGVEVGVEAGVIAGAEAGVEAGVIAGAEVGVEAGVIAGAEVGVEAGAIAGAEVGAAVATDFVTGPIGVALIVFDIANMIVDSYDVDGYDIMEQWDTVTNTINSVLNKLNVDPINEIGPLDILLLQYAPKNELISSQPIRDNTIFDASGHIITPLVDTDLNADLENSYYNILLSKEFNILKAADPNLAYYASQVKLLVDQGKPDEASNFANNYPRLDQIMSNLTKKAYTNLCSKFKGIISNKSGKCIYPKDRCNNSPNPLGPFDIQTIWSDSDNTCYNVLGALKDMCDNAHLDYNIKTGRCTISNEECLSKAGSPYTKKDGSTACHYDSLVGVMQNTFGKTLVNRLVQTFSVNQYKPCDPGYIDEGYLCREECKEGEVYDEIMSCIIKDPKTAPGCDPGYTDTGLTCIAKNVDIGPGIPANISKTCPDDKEYQGGLCYDKCKDGYVSDGATICHWDSPTLSYIPGRVACEDNYNQTAYVCTAKPPPFDVHSSIPIMPHYSCPSGYIKTAFACVGDPPEGYTVNPADPFNYWSTKSASYTVGVGTIPNYDCSTCNSLRRVTNFGLTCTGTKSDGITLATRACHPSCGNKENVGGLCYDRCRDGYTKTPGEGLICWNKSPAVLPVKKLKALEATCNSNRELRSGLCYSACPEGYHRPDGLLNCVPSKGVSYTRDAEPCRDGYDNYAGTCWRNYYNRGGGSIPMSCNSNRELVDSLCYKRCPDGLHHLKGMPFQCVPKRGPSYSKLVLSYIPRTYAKQRRIPYSTKNN